MDEWSVPVIALALKINRSLFKTLRFNSVIEQLGPNIVLGKKNVWRGVMNQLSQLSVCTLFVMHTLVCADDVFSSRKPYAQIFALKLMQYQVSLIEHDVMNVGWNGNDAIDNVIAMPKPVFVVNMGVCMCMYYTY